MIFNVNTHGEQQEYYPDLDPIIQQSLEEWKELKVGLLMHWGTYSRSWKGD
ncbi:MAG: alpha-L-fucosidase [Saprospiraceae bacterium]|nr:alpha-L-fucosidase [Saprospiraceae bacterium]